MTAASSSLNLFPRKRHCYTILNFATIHSALSNGQQIKESTFTLTEDPHRSVSWSLFRRSFYFISSWSVLLKVSGNLLRIGSIFDIWLSSDLEEWKMKVFAFNKVFLRTSGRI